MIYMIVYGENCFTGKPGSRVKAHKGREGKGGELVRRGVLKKRRKED